MRRATSICVWVLVAFVAVAVVAHFLRNGTGLDHRILAWMVTHRHEPLTALADAVTVAASPTATGLLAVVAAVEWWRRYRLVMPALVVVGTVVVTNAVVVVAKRVVAEQRPPGSREYALGVPHSFPSGHVAGTLALLGIVAVLLGRGRSTGVRVLLGAVVVVVTGAVALSRLYLGVHWVTDVGGALMLGSAAVLAGSIVSPGGGGAAAEVRQGSRGGGRVGARTRPD